MQRIYLRVLEAIVETLVEGYGVTFELGIQIHEVTRNSQEMIDVDSPAKVTNLSEPRTTLVLKSINCAGEVAMVSALKGSNIVSPIFHKQMSYQ